MGKHHYLGGNTQLAIYDRKRNLIKKIYKHLKSNLALDYIALTSVEEYFNDYEENELEEILEDVAYNYNNRRIYWFNQIKKSNKKLENKKKTTTVLGNSKGKAVEILNLPIKELIGNLIIFNYKNKNIYIEKNKLIKKNNLELLSAGFIVECHINVKNEDPFILKAKYHHDEEMCKVIYKNKERKSLYVKKIKKDLYFEVKCSTLFFNHEEKDTILI